ncbi:MAG: helix-turn-helix transcriptional regulator [Agathobacter sp.]|nr:helix-turn-helix transcriptional regulator [Agathobacter sp.]
MNSGQKILIGRIENIRKQKNLRNYTVARFADVPVSTLMHITSGDTKNPGVFTILRICEGLGVTPSEFFDDPDFINIPVEE